MGKNNIFTQEGLNNLLNKDRNPQQPVSDTRDPATHPALSTEKDISNHYVLTNSQQNLARFGRESNIPKATQNPPTEGEAKTFPNNGMNQTQQVATPIHQNKTPDSPSSPTDISSLIQSLNQIDSSEELITGLVSSIMNHAEFSQIFFKTLVDNLCSNAQFMVHLRSELLQKLLNEAT